MRITHVLTTIFVATTLSVALVQAQGTTSQKKTVSPEVSPTSSKTRDRRTPSPVVDAGATAASAGNSQSPAATPSGETAPVTPSPSSSPQATTQPGAPAPKKIDAPAPKPEEPSVTESTPAEQNVSTALRDQIDAAENPQEQIRLQLQLADELVRAGKKAEAIEELHRITGTDVFDPQSFYNTGNSLARLGDTDGAINAYRKAIEQRKGNYSRAYNNLGVILLRAGRWDEAYNALLSALKLENFRYPEASYNLGRLYAVRGESDLAMREWRRVLALNPDHTAAREAIARLGSEGRIEVQTSSAAPSRPRNSEVNKPVFTAKTSEKPVSTKPSTETKPRVLTVDQTTYEFLQRARTSSERGKTQDAIDSYKRVISRQGGYFPPANLELSYLLIVMKSYDEALANLVLVANRDGARYPLSYFHLARLYELNGNLKDAESAFSLAADAYRSTNSQFLLDLSRVREKQGDFKGALDAMQQYVDAMAQQGQRVNWSDERLAALRQKANIPK